MLAAAAKEWFHHVTVEVKCNHTHTCTLKKKKQQKKRNNNKKKPPKLQSYRNRILTKKIKRIFWVILSSGSVKYHKYVWA